MSFIRLLPSSERLPMRLGWVAFQKGYFHQPEKLFSGDSYRYFAEFARLDPFQARKFLTVVHRLGPDAKKVFFDPSLLQLHNRPVIDRFISDHEFARSV